MKCTQYCYTKYREFGNLLGSLADPTEVFFVPQIQNLTDSLKRKRLTLKTTSKPAVI